MSFYIGGPVTTDPGALRQRCEDYIQSYAPPGWQLQPGEPLDLFIEFWSIEAASQGDIANTMLDNAFRYFGTLVNVPPIDAQPATSTATFTVQDTAGYTIQAGAVLGLPDATGTLQAFDLLADVVIAPGASTGPGTVQAEQAGVIGNGLSGAAQLIQAPAFVTAATLALTAGGIDAELDAIYLSRLSETLTILSPKFALAKDGAILARTIPGVFRATGVDNLKPGPPYDGSAEATGQEKNVTIAVTDVNGLPVGSTIRASVQAYLDSLREQNFVTWVVDPQYTTIDIDAPGVFSWPGWAPSTVQAAVVTALQALLSPALAQTDPSGTAGRWAADPLIRASAIHQRILEVPGVRYVDPAPTFGISGGALGTADVTLGAGSAIPALPVAGTISVTVTATT